MARWVRAVVLVCAGLATGSWPVEAECSECKQGVQCAKDAECPAICYCAKLQTEPKGTCQSKWGYR